MIGGPPWSANNLPPPIPWNPDTERPHSKGRGGAFELKHAHRAAQEMHGRRFDDDEAPLKVRTPSYKWASEHFLCEMAIPGVGFCGLYWKGKI